MTYDLIKERIKQSVQAKESILNDEGILSDILNLADRITDSLKNGHKIITCGNGGSASDALHFAGEIVGRFERDRDAWPAVVLNTDFAAMTAISNDYGYDEVFSRQAQALANDGDVFVGISTSGNSVNVLRAIQVAKGKGAYTAALLGKSGGKIAEEADLPIIVHNDNTARIQECHILIIHILCEIIENNMTGN